eukprot:Pgem_evm1s19424
MFGEKEFEVDRKHSLNYKCYNSEYTFSSSIQSYLIRKGLINSFYNCNDTKVLEKFENKIDKWRNENIKHNLAIAYHRTHSSNVNSIKQE